VIEALGLQIKIITKILNKVIQRTNKIFIGKDIDRTAAVTATIGDGGSEHFTLTSHIVDGEIVVLDKYKRVLAPGATISDSDVIYICQGTGSTYAWANEPGTTTSSASVRIRISDPIQGKNVKSYTGLGYSVATQQVSTFTTTFTPVVGTEYILRIVYKDIWEHPGQFTATYRYVSTTATLGTFLDAFVAKINKHTGRRIVASTNSTSTLVLTGLPIPQCTTGLNDLDKFTIVSFKAFFDYVSTTAPKGYWTTVDNTALVETTAPYSGVGMWESVRDEEREAWGYLGITNRTHYPIILPDASAVVGATYNIVTIEHDSDYLSPDNQYVKQTPLTTRIAFRVPTTGIAAQQTVVLTSLNTWMASCPKKFNAITL
jgi:hypothetical protein